MSDRPPEGDSGHGHDHGTGMTCAEAFARLYEYLDGELGPEDQEAVQRHLEVCRRCWPYFDFECHFLDWLHERGGRASARPELERRVRELLEAERAKERG